MREIDNGADVILNGFLAAVHDAPDLLYLRASNALWLKKASPQSPMRLTPTNLGILALLIVAVLVGQALQSRSTRAENITFEQIEGLPGWRRATFDGVTRPGGTANSAVFAGLGDDATGTMDPGALCAFLYPNAGETLQATHFSDLNCPNCLPLERKLRTRLDVTRIELPLLGQGSETTPRPCSPSRCRPRTRRSRRRSFDVSSKRPGRSKPADPACTPPSPVKPKTWGLMPKPSEPP